MDAMQKLNKLTGKPTVQIGHKDGPQFGQAQNSEQLRQAVRPVHLSNNSDQPQQTFKIEKTIPVKDASGNVVRKIHFVSGIINRKDLQANPHTLFLFGGNAATSDFFQKSPQEQELMRSKAGGMAGQMLGETNAGHISTCWNFINSSDERLFFSHMPEQAGVTMQKDFAKLDLAKYPDIVIPVEKDEQDRFQVSLGRGAAQLHTRCPQIYNKLLLANVLRLTKEEKPDFANTLVAESQVRAAA